MKTRLIYISLMLFALSAHGETPTSTPQPSVDSSPVVSPPSNTDANDPANRYNEYDGRGSGFVNTIKDTAPAVTTKAPVQDSINPGAQAGQSSQSSGAALNAAVGSALIAACLAPCPKRCNMPLCAMGAMALMQAGHDAGAAGESYAAFDASKYGPNTVNSDPNGVGGFDKDKLELAKNKLSEAGYQVSETGVKYPDGSTYGSTDLISPAAMESAGLGAGAAIEAQSLVDSIVADATKDANSGRVSGVAINGGGGGGSGSGGESGSSSGLYGAAAYKLSADDKKRMIAGKTVMFDGEPIGVRGNNIFEMVHQAYQKKRQGNHFIETADNSGATVRAPASLPSLKPSGK